MPMLRKLDMGQAWNDAVAMLTRNRDVTLIVAAVFFFLPNAISTVAMPGTAELQGQMAAAGEADPEAMMEALSGFYAEIWWVLLLIALLQAVGMLAMLVLWTDRSRPTVGQALTFAVKALVPLLVAQFLAVLLIVLAVMLPIALGALISGAVAALLGLAGLVAAIYLWVKFSLTAPVVAIERTLNPIAILQQSWRATKGNSLRIFAFVLLLAVCAIVIMLLVSMLVSIFALGGEQVGLFASAIIGSLVNMVLVLVFVAVIAAIYRQLAGTGAATVRDTFD